MTRILRKRAIIIGICIILFLTGCNVYIAIFTHSFDILSMGVTEDAQDYLDYYGYETYTEYSGADAEDMLDIVDYYPPSDDYIYYDTGYTYSETTAYLEDLNLPTSLASYAIDDMSAYYYTTTSGYYWIIFVEDVTSSSRSLKALNRQTDTGAEDKTARRAAEKKL